MKSFATLVAALMLLVSLAAATGSNNTVYVKVYSEAMKNCITGDLVLAQITGAESYVFGCDNYADQYMEFYANNNRLSGFGDDLSSLAQVGEMTANATDSDNYVNQIAWTDSYFNCLTGGAQIQSISESALALGCENTVYHDIYLNSFFNTVIDGVLTQTFSVQSHL